MKKQWKWLLTALALVAVWVIAALLYRNLSGRYSSAPTTEAVTQTETVPDEETGAAEETDASDTFTQEAEPSAPESAAAPDTAAAQSEAAAQSSTEQTATAPTTAAAPTTTATTAPSTTAAPTTTPQQRLDAVAPTTAPESRLTAPDFIVYDQNDAQVHLTDHFGKPLVVNFWASWCGPCCSELPAFDAAAKENAGQIDFMMVNLTDGVETVEKASNFIRTNGYSFPVYFDVDENAASTYGIYSIPVTLFIRPDGSVLAARTGSMDQATLQSYLTQLLA